MDRPRASFGRLELATFLVLGGLVAAPSPPPSANLTAVGVIVTAARHAPGASIPVAVDLRSIGYTGNAPVELFFSLDRNLDSSDPSAGSTPVFFSGGTTRLTTSVIHDVPTPGRYYVIAEVNPSGGGGPAESVVNDNVAASSQTVELLGADLSVDRFAVRAEPALPVAGVVLQQAGLRYEIDVSNLSADADALGFLCFAKGYDPVVGSARSTVWASVIGPFDLRIGQSRTLTATLALGMADLGAHDALVACDYTNVVPDTRRNNNAAAHPTSIDVRAPTAELTGTVLGATSPAAAGEPVALSSLIDNLGSAPASTVEYRYRLVDGAGLGTDLGSGRVSVPAEGSAVVQDDMTVPADLTAGRYRLQLVLDPNQLVSQLTRRNDVVDGPEIDVLEPGLRIVTEQLPTGFVAQSYRAVIVTTGGAGTVRFRAEGRLPEGIVLDGVSGELSGVPTESGLFPVKIFAEGAAAARSRQFQLPIAEGAESLAVSTDALPPARYGYDYEARLRAQGGYRPIAGRRPVPRCLGSRSRPTDESRGAPMPPESGGSTSQSTTRRARRRPARSTWSSSAPIEFPGWSRRCSPMAESVRATARGERSAWKRPAGSPR